MRLALYQRQTLDGTVILENLETLREEFSGWEPIPANQDPQSEETLHKSGALSETDPLLRTHQVTDLFLVIETRVLDPGTGDRLTSQTIFERSAEFEIQRLEEEDGKLKVHYRKKL